MVTISETATIFILGFIHQLPGHVLRGQLQTENSWTGMSDFVFNICLVICKFQTEIFAGFHSFACIRYRMKPSKDNDTLYIQRPFSIFAVTLVIHTVRNFITGLYGINFMSFFCTMEIKFPMRW